VTARLSVLDPRGYAPVPAAAGPLARRLETLEGKTVCLVDCQFENSGVFLEQLQAWLTEHLPTVTAPILRWRGEVYAHRDEETLREVATRGDAAILGVGL
jgi:hypothetical protein